jgi:hypothetical protein
VVLQSDLFTYKGWIMPTFSCPVVYLVGREALSWADHLHKDSFISFTVCKHVLLRLVLIVIFPQLPPPPPPYCHMIDSYYRRSLDW